MAGKSQLFQRASTIQFAGLILVTLMFGCGPRLSFQNVYELPPGDIKAVILNPVSQEQTIKVHAHSSGGLFHVHVYLEPDEAEVDLAIARKEASDKIIASSESTKDVTLDAKIPANQTGVVRLQAAGGDAVSVTIDVQN